VRVLFLTHNFPRFVGDVPGSFLLRLAEALVADGVAVEVLAPGAPGLAAREEIRSVPVTRFRYAPRRYETLAYTGTMAADVRRSLAAKVALGGFFAAQYVAARGLVRRFRPDVVHAHWWFPSGLTGSWLPRALPLITTSHGSDVVLARSKRAAQPAFRRVIRRSAAVTAVSGFLAAMAREIAPDAAVAVAPMPVDVGLFSPDGERSADRLLFVGRLNMQKGIDDAIRALAALPSSVTLDVVGEGERASDVRTLAASLGVTDRVRWHGRLTQGELLPLYRAATALLMPSTNEGLGLVAVEAALCATPTVAYASGGLVDVVRDGVTGRLVPEGDPTALAAAAAELIVNPAVAHSLGAAARQDALARFSPAHAAAVYRSIYAAAVAGGAA
jgi:glycosyltransferase involved in cell wall biosynthesis